MTNSRVILLMKALAKYLRKSHGIVYSRRAPVAMTISYRALTQAYSRNIFIYQFLGVIGNIYVKLQDTLILF